MKTPPLRSSVAAVFAGLATLLLSGCKPELEAPTDKGVCYHMTKDKAGYHFFELGRDLPSLEYCAAALERMRLHFIGMGGSHTEIAGAYQGQFIFVEKQGISTAPSLNVSPFLVLVRSNDGRLVAPGSLPPQDVLH